MMSGTKQIMKKNLQKMFQQEMEKTNNYPRAIEAFIDRLVDRVFDEDGD